MIVWNAVMTAVVLKLVSLVVPLRASDGEVEGGDLAIHGIDPVPIYAPPSTNGNAAAPSPAAEVPAS
jgi:hypothetical protein